MNVARLNCSHGDWETRKKWVQWIRELSPEVAPVAILADLQGPKFRIGEIPVGAVQVWKGQALTIGNSIAATIPVLQPEVLKELEEGNRLLLGDGNVEMKLLARQEAAKGQTVFSAKVLNGGVVKSRQGLTVVGKVFYVPALTEKDREDIEAASKVGVDFMALSYVHSAADMLEFRQEVEKRVTGVRLCAKIETRAALKCLDQILEASDLVMVARGDMGLQMDVEDVPLAQKRIISEANRQGVPVITATQMLESMLVNPRPTRAEATDIANAVLDGTDAVMLSGETAAGEYPIEAVRYMSKIAESAEHLFSNEKALDSFCLPGQEPSRTEAVAHAAAQLATATRPKAIITTTTSGQTARLVSKFRPRTPVLCATWNKQTLNQMAVVWGVEALLIPEPTTTDEIVANAFEGFVKKKRLKPGDVVIITAGVPAGIPGHTNLILMEVVKT
jgi:pyruvate kinase